MSKSVAQGTGTGNPAQGNVFTLKSNSSLIGFKGTEDLGNGLKGLFQVESEVVLTGQQTAQGVNAGSTAASGLGSLRDSYVGLNSKYGTVLGGFLSTPYRSALTSFDVMPGATGDGRIETFMGAQRFGYNGANTGYVTARSSVRATALAYAMPTLYGFNGSIAYTGSNNNGSSNQTTQTIGVNTGTTVLPQNALSLNLGWAGYGVDIKGAFQQAKVNGSAAVTSGTFNDVQAPVGANSYTSYLIGAAYTGVPGLKASVVYNRNSMSLNDGNVFTSNANKGSNNQFYAGVSYRFGNNEPRIAYSTTSNTSFNGGTPNDGGNMWAANWGYYMSKRTQVYGIVSAIKNNQNGVWSPASGGTSMLPTGGQSILTYGAGVRTNF